MIFVCLYVCLFNFNIRINKYSLVHIDDYCNQALGTNTIGNSVWIKPDCNWLLWATVFEQTSFMELGLIKVGLLKDKVSDKWVEVQKPCKI